MRYALASATVLSIAAAANAQQSSTNQTLTAVPGLQVGSFTLSERPTGCTVVLAAAGAIAGVDVRGAAPGTRETDLLNPTNMVERVHAVVLSGGSAFGLDAASGVMRFLDARVLLRDGAVQRAAVGGNTTLGVVATNRSLTKAQATKVAQMAHDGLARTIYPIHTPADGDTIFALSTATDTAPADVGRIGALAAQVIADAVMRAALEATGLPGYPAARDLGR